MLLRPQNAPSRLHRRGGDPDRHREAVTATEDGRPEVARGDVDEDARQEAVPRKDRDLLRSSLYGICDLD